MYRIYNNDNNKSVERNTEEKIDLKNIMPCANLFVQGEGREKREKFVVERKNEGRKNSLINFTTVFFYDELRNHST